MTSIASRRRAQAHAKHPFHCSCGAIVHGNGARFMHRDMHERHGDGHHYVTASRFDLLFPDWWQLPFPERTARKVDGPFGGDAR